MTDQIDLAYAAAVKLVNKASELGLIHRPRNKLVSEAFRLARVDVVLQMLLATRMGEWAKTDSGRADWEFAKAFGPLVRLARFEMIEFRDDQGWTDLLQLLRLYIGEGADKIAIPVFLAAVTSPEFLISAKMKADCQRIANGLEPEMTAQEAF